MPENCEEDYLTWSSANRFTVIQHETHTNVNAGKTHVWKLVCHEKISMNPAACLTNKLDQRKLNPRYCETQTNISQVETNVPQ